ncbi:uncharacterized protein LOC105185723 [Harpegnathos saltator]|uniref:uncharacterized protein LOC105185723 n=1 Tax=Harpegnathos saltator TaxID=610380 RepID=UPI00058D1B3C|nr:uncharacterized protein LOC105185723 [Harpegnathos saltator]
MRGEIGARIILSVLLAVSIFSPPMSGALVTFGKTNPQNQNQNPPPPPTPVGKARECKVHSDCIGIQNTSCISDHQDGRRRCLCGDYSAPLNGLCANKYKALHVSCNDNSECIEDAQCTVRNATLGKRCYCEEGFFEESPLFCNGCSSIFTLYTMTLLAASLMLGRLNYV